ncbi:MAG: hypothetical protein ABI647_13665 [Gemmatimonadota bacterium]
MRQMLFPWAAGLALAAPLSAQAPGTEVYLAKLTRRGSGLEVGEPKNLTNRPGYDNQPSFSPDGRVLFYTSTREDAQADIYKYDLRRAAATKFTDTPESEYSATVMPGGKEVSVIRVERDSTQRLWAFPLAGGAPRIIVERVKPVGYHAWADATTVALYVLGSPATLVVANVGSGDTRSLLSNVGRSLHRVPKTRLISVTQVVAEGTTWIVEVDPATGVLTPVVKTVPGSQDYAWTPDGAILMGAGPRLYRFRPGIDSAFVQIAELKGPGLQKIGRLAVSPKGDWLAIVSEEAR